MSLRRDKFVIGWSCRKRALGLRSFTSKSKTSRPDNNSSLLSHHCPLNLPSRFRFQRYAQRSTRVSYPTWNSIIRPLHWIWTRQQKELDHWRESWKDTKENTTVFTVCKPKTRNWKRFYCSTTRQGESRMNCWWGVCTSCALSTESCGRRLVKTRDYPCRCELIRRHCYLRRCYLDNYLS